MAIGADNVSGPGQRERERLSQVKLMQSGGRAWQKLTGGVTVELEGWRMTVITIGRIGQLCQPCKRGRSETVTCIPINRLTTVAANVGAGAAGVICRAGLGVERSLHYTNRITLITTSYTGIISQ
jgi:hypothetical protein